MALRGHWAMEVTCTHQGEFAVALAHFNQALRCPPVNHRDGFLDALDPNVAFRCFAAWSLWFAGWPDRADACMQEAVLLARVRSEPHGLAHALVFAAILAQLRRECRVAAAHADAAIAVAQEHGLVLYIAMATIVRGWATFERRGDAQVIGDIRQGLAGWQSTGALLMRPHFMAMLADALDPDDEEGVRLLDEALAIAEATGERSYQAELYRLKGERILRRDASASVAAAAKTCFQQAIEIARRQQARSLELRAALSLARLHQRSDADRAHDLVAPIYAWFVEGFETSDLRDARMLLDPATTGGSIV
jgi:predicted ATPase